MTAASQQSRATAAAHPNIAVVKYWGKRDEALILPHQSSVSVAMAPLEVRTTVVFGTGGGEDEVVLNGRAAQGEQRRRVVALLADVRGRKKEALGSARVVSAGNFPMGAGLASSAAGFAALAVAASAAARLELDSKQVSILARVGSGSACRSVPGGFAVWRRGVQPDGSDSVAELLYRPEHWPELRVVVAVVSAGEKEVTSRDGMRRTVETSPYYPAWAKDAETEVARAADFIRRRDLQALGLLSERNAWRMHATALAADPPLCYLQPATLKVLLALEGERQRGLPVWFTLDAGPNPALLTDATHADAVAQLARSLGAADVRVCHPGGPARLVSEHLA